MLGLALKWMTIGLVVLTLFSAATVFYGLYQLNLGACRSGCEQAQTFTAYIYVGLVGVTGFSVSGFAAYMIGKSFRNED